MNALESGTDIGSSTILRQYENERYYNNVMMMGGIDALQRFFSFQFLPVSLVRNFGLSLTNSISPVKKVLMQMAFGSHLNISRIGRNANKKVPTETKVGEVSNLNLSAL